MGLGRRYAAPMSSTLTVTVRATPYMRTIILLILLCLPGTALASDFSILMWLLLIPFFIGSLIVWAITWPVSAEIENRYVKAIIRIIGLCFILTPTFTSGGNGQMVSVAMYDFVMTLFGGDVVYAKQAFINIVVSIPVVYLLYLLATAKSKSSNG